MKKRFLTALLSVVAAASVTTGVAVTAMAKESAAKQHPSNASTETVLNENGAYYVTAENSSASYAKDNNSDVMGVKATLALGDKLTFRNVINLEEFSQKGESFLDIKPYVEQVGVSEYTRILVEVIDVYDSTNYFKIQFSAAPGLEDASLSKGGNIAYFLACASNGQKLSGYESANGKLHVNNQYGEYSFFSFSDQSGKDSGTGFYYDVERKTISAVTSTGIKRQIIDFDDPKFFGTYLWGGFTTNEVYCRVSCSDYKKDTATVLISKYGNYDLSNPEICDETAPALVVDYGEYTKDTIPSALAGTAYKVFPSSAFDTIDGAQDVEVKVYRNYYSAQKQEVSINAKTGTFKPQIAVPHHIVYTATDSRGNVAQEIVPVNVLSSIDQLELVFDEFALETVEGNAYSLPAYLVNGSVGNARVSVRVELNGKELKIEKDSVRPFAVGEMKIFYAVEDYVGRTYETEQTITVTAAEKPTFIETPILPKYLIQGHVYTFPKINAYDYMQGAGEAISTTVHVVENGKESELNGNVYTVGDAQEAEIIYRAKIGSAINEYRKVLPVYDVEVGDDLDMSKFFLVSGNGVATTDDESVSLSVTSDGSFEYLNSVLSRKFRTEFLYTAAARKPMTFHIRLTDIEDEGKYLQFTYAFNGSNTSFYVNGNKDDAVQVSVALNVGNQNSLNFDAENKQVYYDISNNNIVPVNTFANGEAFDGFTDGKAYVTYAFENVKSDASMKICSINDNYFSNETADWIAPLIEMDGDVGGEFVLGSTFTLPKIFANDVLDGDVAVYVTVTTPSGNILYSTDGRALDELLYEGEEIQIKLTEYGAYCFYITASDRAGNQGYSTPVLTVVDTQKPTLQINGSIPTTVSVGANVDVPKASVSDNLTQSVTLKIFVITATGVLLDVTNATGFKANVAGLYTVIYYAMDSDGNFTSEYHYVKAA